jgi:1-pyrroline-5-carboxylate dehydrogenase
VASRAFHAPRALVGEAVAAARESAWAWRTTAWRDRCALLRSAAQEIGDRHLELAGVVSLEIGKPRLEAIAEIQEGIDLINTYCDYMEAADGFVTPMRSLAADERNTSYLKPYGVFGVISPFNFPFALSINMAAGALVMGNTIVYKPSEEAPWSGSLAGEILASALPRGVVNVIHGGSPVGRALVESAVDGIAFTGSAAVGREIARTLREGGYPRPVLTELGGKNPVIVASSAALDAASEGTARSAFGFSGQKCSSCSRAIVLADVHDEFVERAAACAQELRVGDPLDRDTDIGPVVDRGAVDRFRRAVADARADGRVVAGGNVLDRPGCYVEPTVVSELPLGHRLTREEQFLPFLTVTRVGSFEEALAEANAVDYGLTAGVFSEEAAERERFLDEIEAGVVYVNRRAGATTGAWPGVQSFCGWKNSGAGGKGGLGPHYLQQFTREQSHTIVA